MVAKAGSKKTIVIIATIAVVVAVVFTILFNKTNGLNKNEVARQIASNMMTTVVAPGPGGINGAQEGLGQEKEGGIHQTGPRSEFKNGQLQEAPVSATNATTSPWATSSPAGLGRARPSSAGEKAGLQSTSDREEAQQPSRIGGREGDCLGARCLDRGERQDENTDRFPDSPPEQGLLSTGQIRNPICVVGGSADYSNSSVRPLVEATAPPSLAPGSMHHPARRTSVDSSELNGREKGGDFGERGRAQLGYPSNKSNNSFAELADAHSSDNKTAPGRSIRSPPRGLDRD